VGINLSYVTPLLAAGAAAVAIVAAPTAAAAPTPLPKICAPTVAGTTCQLPGNVQITHSLPGISFYPYGTMPYLLGGH
jgi:hypothetical protein